MKVDVVVIDPWQAQTMFWPQKGEVGSWLPGRSKLSGLRSSNYWQWRKLEVRHRQSLVTFILALAQFLLPSLVSPPILLSPPISVFSSHL